MAQPPRISNHYVRRLAGTPKSCLVCYRPSPVVLVSVSIPTHDFFYVCTTHLADRHFANRLPTPGEASAAGGDVPGRLPDKVSKEEIDKVTQEWKDRQKAKEEREKSAAAAKEKEKEKEAKGWLSTVAGAAGTAASAVSSLASSAMTSSPSPSDPSASATATPPLAPALPPGQHEHYQLHKDYFAMRKDALNKRAALQRAKELNMPAVPSKMPTLPSAPSPR
ncbi:hypothetical protein CF319_g3927 [Tilletia indica]|uniref:DUF1742-domain-containing protein n=1 Tax=Tilletia walkeri TaxID=117179 RepID=A0A8X7NCX4_9BASI|nr:hypothetical protein CF319_g3927 [Tilletia indica]KAE8270964.1 hypothetical protein A4X09_0g1376 [Tilletia walkeri]